MSFRNNNRGSRFSAETRLGLPRPSLDSMRTVRNPQQSEAETDYDEDDYYYDDDDDDEAEALLSRKHGEAAEASTVSSTTTTNNNNNKPKRPSTTSTTSTDQDIADEYAQQEKERKKKIRRKVTTIVPDDLIRSKGLTVVRNGIALKFQNQNYSATPKSMARCSRRLVASYSDWMETMTGGLSLHEMHWKLRAMSSKTQIKQYLQDMRKVVRNDHVERLLGLEKAQRLLGQLEDYYNEEQQQQQHQQQQLYDDDAVEEQNNPVEGEDAPSPAMANPYTTVQAAAERPLVAVTPGKPTEPEPELHSKNKPQEEREEDPLVRRLALQKEHRARKHVLEDSDDDDDDEEEAIFDDVVPLSTAKSANRRHVLDDDSDDDDDDDDKNDDKNDKESEKRTTEKDSGKEMEHSARTDSTEKVSANEETTNDEECIHEKSKDGTVQNKVEDSGEEKASTKHLDEDSEEENASMKKLDDKFESVKALLEGREPSENAASTEETTEAASTEENGTAVANVVSEDKDEKSPTQDDHESVEEDSINGAFLADSSDDDEQLCD